MSLTPLGVVTSGDGCLCTSWPMVALHLGVRGYAWNALPGLRSMCSLRSRHHFRSWGIQRCSRLSIPARYLMTDVLRCLVMDQSDPPAPSPLPSSPFLHPSSGTFKTGIPMMPSFIYRPNTCLDDCPVSSTYTLHSLQTGQFRTPTTHNYLWLGLLLTPGLPILLHLCRLGAQLYAFSGHLSSCPARDPVHPVISHWS